MKERIANYPHIHPLSKPGGVLRCTGRLKHLDDVSFDLNYPINPSSSRYAVKQFLVCD